MAERSQDPNKIAVVTGANRGLGKVTAAMLAAKGYDVVLAVRDPDAARAVVDEIPRSRALALDVADGASRARFADELARAVGRVDALVHNAGILPNEDDALDVDLDVVRRVIETNVLGAWDLTRRLVPLLAKSNAARVVHVSSGLGAIEGMGTGYAAYRVSKTMLNALTIQLAQELRARGIVVNAVCPGWCRTDMGGKNATRSVERGAEGIVWAATLDDDAPTGGFFRDGRAIAW